MDYIKNGLGFINDLISGTEEETINAEQPSNPTESRESSDEQPKVKDSSESSNKEKKPELIDSSESSDKEKKPELIDSSESSDKEKKPELIDSSESSDKEKKPELIDNSESSDKEKKPELIDSSESSDKEPEKLSKEELEEEMNLLIESMKEGRLNCFGCESEKELNKLIAKKLDSQLEISCREHNRSFKHAKLSLESGLFYKIGQEVTLIIGKSGKKKESKIEELEAIIAKEVEDALSSNPSILSVEEGDLLTTKEMISGKLEDSIQKDPIAKQRNLFLDLSNQLHKNYAALLHKSKKQFGDVFMHSDRFSIQQDVSYKEELILQLRSDLDAEKVKIIDILDVLQNTARKFQSSISKSAIEYQDKQATTNMWDKALTAITSIAGVGFGGWEIYKNHKSALDDTGGGEPDTEQTHSITAELDISGKKTSFSADISAAVTNITGAALIVSTTGASVGLAAVVVQSITGVFTAWQSKQEPVTALQGAAKLLVELMSSTKVNVEKNLENAYNHFEKDTKLWIQTLMDNASQYKKEKRHQEDLKAQDKLLLEKEKKHLLGVNHELNQLEDELDDVDEKLEDLLDNEETVKEISTFLSNKENIASKDVDEILEALLDSVSFKEGSLSPKIKRQIKSRIRKTLSIADLNSQKKDYKTQIKALEEEIAKPLVAPIELDTGSSSKKSGKEKKSSKDKDPLESLKSELTKTQLDYLEEKGLEPVSIDKDGKCLFGSIADQIGGSTKDLRQEILDVLQKFKAGNLEPSLQEELNKQLARSIESASNGLEDVDAFIEAITNNNWQGDMYDKLPQIIAIIKGITLAVIGKDGPLGTFNHGSANLTILLNNQHYTSTRKTK